MGLAGLAHKSAKRLFFLEKKDISQRQLLA